MSGCYWKCKKCEFIDETGGVIIKHCLNVHGGSVDTCAEYVQPAPTCENCRFFQALFCRKNPPSMLPSGEGAWPVVSEEGWCGAHERRES